LQNFSTLYLSCADYLESSKYSESNPAKTATVVATAVFIFFFTTILIYWLFGFKYWIISREVPRFLEGNNNMSLSERKYFVINYIAISSIVLICGIACLIRGIVSY
jgi:hypothetical protein